MNARILAMTLTLPALAACNGAAPEDQVVDTSPSDTATQQLGYPRTYLLTIQNVTAANAISPPIAVLATRDFRLFDVGAVASAGIAKIAETGATDVLETELNAKASVKLVAKAAGGPLMAGTTRTIEIKVPAGLSSPRLNLAAMIGKSNDSFVSRAESIDITLADYGTVVVSLTNFDSGSEQNTGNVEDFGSTGHPTAEAEGLISYDRGLNPRGNAPDKIGWGSIAAVVRIERVR